MKNVWNENIAEDPWFKLRDSDNNIDLESYISQ